MRPQDWPNRLALFHQEKAHQPFVWGHNDCCMFAADWICILTGKDPAKKFRGKYDSRLGAARVLKRHGGVIGIADKICAAKNWPVIPVTLARRGDILAYETENGPALGVCDGSRVMFPVGSGIALVSLLKCIRAWRIDP